MRRPGDSTRKELLLPYKNGKRPPNTQVLAVPANRQVVFCQGAANCPGANGTSQYGKYWYLFKLSKSKTNPIPQITGTELNESNILADVDQNTGQPIVQLQFNHEGAKQFAAITKAEYDRGRFNAGQAGQLGNTDQQTVVQYAGHNAIVLDGKLEETPYIDYTDSTLQQGIVGGNAQITRAELEGGSEHRARPPERLAAVHVQADLVVDRLCDARQELAPPGDPRGRDRPTHGRGLPARPVPLPGPRRRLRPRDLCGPVLRGDPSLQRDADLAGVRGPDPHDRRRGRRERRRVRTHQGGGARRAIGASGDLGGLRQGLPHDSRRERRDGDHRDGHLPDRRGGCEGLCPDAADRHRDLAAHRGRGDARDARAAERLPLVRQPALHGCARSADGEVAPDRLHAAPLPVVCALGCRDPRGCGLARRARPEPRDRLQGRHEDHVQHPSGVLAGLGRRLHGEAGSARRGRPGLRHMPSRASTRCGRSPPSRSSPPSRPS